MELVNGACRKQRSRAPLSQTHVAKGPLTGRCCVRPAYDLGSEFVSFKEISPGERNRQTPGKSRGRRYAKISLVGGVVWLAMEGGVCRASIAQHRVSSRTGGVEGGGGISGGRGGVYRGERGAWGLVKLEARGPSPRPGLGPALEAMAPCGKGIQQMTLLVLPTAHCPDGPVRGNKSDPARSIIPAWEFPEEPDESRLETVPQHLSSRPPGCRVPEPSRP